MSLFLSVNAEWDENEMRDVMRMDYFLVSFRVCFLVGFGCNSCGRGVEIEYLTANPERLSSMQGSRLMWM